MHHWHSYSRARYASIAFNIDMSSTSGFHWNKKRWLSRSLMYKQPYRCGLLIIFITSNQACYTHHPTPKATNATNTTKHLFLHRHGDQVSLPLTSAGFYDYDHSRIFMSDQFFIYQKTVDEDNYDLVEKEGNSKLKQNAQLSHPLLS